MKFDLHTYDIQRLVIALICSHDHTEEEDKNRIMEKLEEMNLLCTEENNYTLKITVEA